MTRTLKLEYRDGPSRHTRWLSALPSKMARDCALTISEPDRAVAEVVISTADPRIALGSHAVAFSDGATTYWMDAGGDFAAAVVLAEQVLARGVAAYEAWS